MPRKIVKCLLDLFFRICLDGNSSLTVSLFCRGFFCCFFYICFVLGFGFLFFSCLGCVFLVGFNFFFYFYLRTMTLLLFPIYYLSFSLFQQFWAFISEKENRIRIKIVANNLKHKKNNSKWTHTLQQTKWPGNTAVYCKVKSKIESLS